MRLINQSIKDNRRPIFIVDNDQLHDVSSSVTNSIFSLEDTGFDSKLERLLERDDSGTLEYPHNFIFSRQMLVDAGLKIQNEFPPYVTELVKLVINH